MTKKKTNLWTKNFILITIINLLIYCCWQMFPSALPKYLSGLGGADSVIGLVNGLSTIATIIIRGISGKIMDTAGRKGIFNLGLVLLLVTTIGLNFSPAIGIILFVRFFHGLAWGIASTASNTIASENIPQEQMGTGMGIFSLSISLSSAIAPAIALYLLNKSFGYVVILGGIFIAAAMLLNMTITYKDIEPATGDSGGGIFEKKAALPAVLGFLFTITYGGIITFVPIYAQQRGIENIGMFFTLYAVAMLVTRPLMGWLIDNKGNTITIILGSVFLLAGLLSLYMAETYNIFLIAGVLYGIGYGALSTCLQTMAVLGVAPNRLGAANATYFTGFDGGIGFGSVVGGFLAQAVGYSTMYLLLGIFPIAIVICYIVALKKQ